MENHSSAESSGSSGRKSNERVIVFQGAHDGPRLAIVGRPGDLSAVMDRLELEGETARLSGQLEFYAHSKPKPDPSRCLVLPADEVEGSLMSASKCYLAVLDCVASLGMREEPSAGRSWKRTAEHKAARRKTGSEWKMRQW